MVRYVQGIALEVAEKGIRCNCIAPGPVWTPLVVSSFPTEKVRIPRMKRWEWEMAFGGPICQHALSKALVVLVLALSR